MLLLIMNPGLPEEKQFALKKGSITIGRTQDNAVFCLHKSLSRRHAQVDYDGVKVKVTDLQSKNGIYFNGKRVTRCEVLEGESFRCGEITFLLEGSTARSPRNSNSRTAAALQKPTTPLTLPSPLALDPGSTRRRAAQAPRPITDDHDPQRYKDKLFLLIRASELCVSGLSIDAVLEELVALAVQLLELDRIVLVTLDDASLELKARVVKTSIVSSQYPYSSRVVNWVIGHGSPASFADVSRDRSLPGDVSNDFDVRGAMCVPINPGGGTIGVIYADSLSRIDCFRPDDLALLRALANLAAVALESAALRTGNRQAILNR